MSSHKLNNSEQGIVAIVVTFMFLIVISLTALGLARMARREQRQTLDSQLSSQAYYLAQAGINDGIAATKSGYYSDLNNNKTTCAPDSVNLPPQKLEFFRPGNTDSDAIRTPLGGISAEGQYSCILINHSPDDIRLSVSTDKSKLSNMIIEDSSGAAPTAPYFLVIGWDNENDTNNTDFVTSPVGEFSVGGSTGVWGVNTGVLRLDITGDVGNPTRANSNAKTMTAYLYPKRNGSQTVPVPVDFSSMVQQQRGAVLDGKCFDTPLATTGRRCNVAIRVNNATYTNLLFARLKSIYNNSKVTIKAFSDSSFSTALKFKGSQIVIDSTGKVQDITKRIQVRVSSTSDYVIPEYAMESVEGICKRMYTAPTLLGTTYNGAGVGAGDQDVCDPTKP